MSGCMSKWHATPEELEDISGGVQELRWLWIGFNTRMVRTQEHGERAPWPLETDESAMWKMHRDIAREIGQARKVAVAKCWEHAKTCVIWQAEEEERRAEARQAARYRGPVALGDLGAA